MSVSKPAGRPLLKYKVHWHVMFTHFPISLYMASALFMVLHEFTLTACFEEAGFYLLLAATAVLIPTTLTGWFTWKRQYKAARTRIFTYKIRIAYAMLTLSILLIPLRVVFIPLSHTTWHFIYAAGFVALFLGSLAEGYYGGRLNHR